MDNLSILVIHSAHAPIFTSRRQLVARPSLSACWQSEVGPVFGEATPLPAYGSDDFDKAKSDLSTLTAEQLKGVARQIVEIGPPKEPGLHLGPGTAAGCLQDAFSEFSSPSARWCAEMLVLGAAAGSCGVPMWRLLASECVAHKLPTSMVVDPWAADWHTQWQEQLSRGVRTFKLKCGRDSAHELSALSSMSESPGAVSIRLDPNGAWNQSTARDFLSSCQLDCVDWVEDPTSDPISWKSLREETGAPIAIDEPLSVHMTVEQLKAIDPDVLVLKPMAIGGAAACVRWAEWAKRRGKSVSISHLFDGHAAMGAAIHLAFALQSPHRAPGLGPHAALLGPDDRAPYPAELGEAELLCPL